MKEIHLQLLEKERAMRGIAKGGRKTKDHDIRAKSRDKVVEVIVQALFDAVYDLDDGMWILIAGSGHERAEMHRREIVQSHLCTN